MQRVGVDARALGLRRRRLRHFRFGSRHGRFITVTRPAAVTELDSLDPARHRLALRARHVARADAPGRNSVPFKVSRQTSCSRRSPSARHEAVGNGVPVPMARAVAVAVRNARLWHEARACECGCGRGVTGRVVLAAAACRKRMERRRKCDQPARCDAPGGTVGDCPAAPSTAGTGPRSSSWSATGFGPPAAAPPPPGSSHHASARCGSSRP